MTGQNLAWVGLGSNEGNAVANVRQAAERLAAHHDLHDFALSPFYRTRPWGVTDQPDFVNAVARLRTALTPETLLDLLLGLERSLGRQREGRQRWGPRCIDLDLLLVGDLQLEIPRLVLPHPHLHERAFVLVPMLDLDDGVLIPGHGSARECLSRLGRQGVMPLAEGNEGQGGPPLASG